MSLLDYRIIWFDLKSGIIDFFQIKLLQYIYSDLSNLKCIRALKSLFSD